MGMDMDIDDESSRLPHDADEPDEPRSNGNGHSRDDWFDIQIGPESQPERHELLGMDPFYEEFHRTPFDPLFAAQVGGRLTGEVLRRPPGRGWMRAVAYLMAALLVVAGLSGLLAAGGFIAPYQPSPTWTLVKVLAFSVGFLLIAVFLLWKLLHSSRSENEDLLMPADDDDDDYDDLPNLP